LSKEIQPPAGTKILFKAATAFVRKARTKRTVRLTGTHRGYVVVLERGYILIDQQWFPK